MHHNLEKAAEKKRRLKKKNFRNFLTGLPHFRRYSEKFGLGESPKTTPRKTGQFLGGQGVAHSWAVIFF
jgi:hypothetical protein